MSFNKITTIYMSSADRVSGTTTDFRVRLDAKIHNITKIEVQQVILPMTIYNITPSCNRLRFVDSTLLDATIQITPGSYNVNTVSTILEQSLNSNSTDMWTVMYDSITLKFKISNATGAFSLQPTTQSINTKIGLQSTASSVVDGVEWSLTSEVVLFGLPLYCYVESHALSNHTYDVKNYHSTNANENNKSIIAKLGMSENSGEGVVYHTYVNKDSSTSVISPTGVGSIPQLIDVRLRFPSADIRQTEFDLMTDWNMDIHVHFN